jgi:glycosyltransferase involved in cell wall biosynthesis
MIDRMPTPPVTALSQPVSLLMPVCNEADVIEGVIEEWVAEVISRLPPGSELLIDEAASTDGTREILQRLCAKYPFIRVTYNERKDGFGPAARRLYAAARCPLVFFTDSDGQYVPSEFWKLAPFAAEFDIVHGAKVGRQDSFFRKVASAAFNRIARFLFDEPYTDINSAFRIVKKEALERLLPSARCLPTLLNAELLLRAALTNLSIKQVRVAHRPRRFGKSRGLPFWAFASEVVRAYRGLFELKDEFRR